MKYNEIIRECNAGKYRSIYFLHGNEPYYIDKIADFIEKNALAEEEKAFNMDILYGDSVSMTTVCDYARQYPVMAKRRVIIVREAQNIKDFSNLQPYIENMQKASVLVFVYKNKKPDMRLSVFKSLSKNSEAAVFESKKIYESELPEWIINHCRENKMKLHPKAATVLSESLGNDLSKIANEIDKLRLAGPKDGIITGEFIENHIGISKEFNNFELIDAINAKDHLKIHRIVNYFASNPAKNPVPQSIALIFLNFKRILTYHYEKRNQHNRNELASLLGINPFFLKDYKTASEIYNAMKCAEIISLSREYDIRAKGGGEGYFDPYQLLKELIFKITH